MKKHITSLIVVLIITAALLVGCTANPAGQDSFQQDNRVGNAENTNSDTALGNSDGNGSHINSNSSGYVETRGNGNGGYGNGQQAGNGDGSCLPAETSIPPVSASPEPEGNETSTLDNTRGYGAAGALADKNLTLAEMLTYAIQDEYLAHAEYAYIINAFENARPFSNIIKAEEQHIQQLLPLFTEYGISAPADAGSDHAGAVSNLTAAYQTGEKAELDNIAMYDAFLKQDLPSDVRTVFESLRDASENHLTAFRKHL